MFLKKTKIWKRNNDKNKITRWSDKRVERKRNAIELHKSHKTSKKFFIGWIIEFTIAKDHLDCCTSPQSTISTICLGLPLADP